MKGKTGFVIAIAALIASNVGVSIYAREAYNLGFGRGSMCGKADKTPEWISGCLARLDELLAEANRTGRPQIDHEFDLAILPLPEEFKE